MQTRSPILAALLVCGVLASHSARAEDPPPDAGPVPDSAAAAVDDIADAGTPATAAPDAGTSDAGAAAPAVGAASAPADAGVADEPEPETPKQQRKRLRRERWRALAGLLGDEIAVKDKDKADAGPAPTDDAGVAPTGDAATGPVDDTAQGKVKKPWKLKNPDLGGFIQVFFRQPFHTGADPNVDFNDFRVLRVRLSVDGEVFPWLAYSVSIDPRAPEITGILRDAYLGFRAFHQELRVGQQKTTFGFENSESSTETYFVNRAEMADAISRANNLRDIGLGLVGDIKVGGGFRIENAFTVVNGAGSNVQADNTATKNVWGRLGARYRNPDWGDLDIGLGGSGGYGDFVDCSSVREPGFPCEVGFADGELISFRRVGADVEIDQEWVFLAAEYGRGWDEIDGEPIQHDAYYASIAAKTPWSVGPSLRYDHASIDGGFERVTFGAYWGMPNDLLRVMVNYEMRLVKDGSRGDDKIFIWTQVEF